jgi:hypothetical protein
VTWSGAAAADRSPACSEWRFEGGRVRVVR